MKDEGAELDVLLIGESVRSFSHIAGRLEKNGCRCRYARSYEEAREVLHDKPFDIVLSVVHPRDYGISSLADTLVGTHASFFYALPVEESCWWLPALRQGERCIGAPALRPSEFANLLDQVVAEIRSLRQSERKPKTLAAGAGNAEEGFTAHPSGKTQV
jgi:hypothetical protein